MENIIDKTALFNIGYGLYVVTTKNEGRDNGLIVNTVTQVSETPLRISVAVSKQNYSHETIVKTGVMNVNCLTVEAPFSLFENFGFRSGRDCDKFENGNYKRSENGLIYLDGFVNSFISLKVEQYIDLDSHGLFICSVTEAQNLSSEPSMSYSYYHANVKPKREAPKSEKVEYVCRICGYVHEGELPPDFICPWCKHGVDDFERV